MGTGFSRNGVRLQGWWYEGLGGGGVLTRRQAICSKSREPFLETPLTESVLLMSVMKSRVVETNRPST